MTPEETIDNLERLASGSRRDHVIEPTIKNAVVESATLGNGEDNHGMLSSWLRLDYGDCTGQGFGGYRFSEDLKGLNVCGLFISRVLEVCGVTDWSKVPGRVIRVKTSAGRIIAIGHAVKDDWFAPEQEFSK